MNAAFYYSYAESRLQNGVMLSVALSHSYAGVGNILLSVVASSKQGAKLLTCTNQLNHKQVKFYLGID